MRKLNTRNFTRATRSMSRAIDRQIVLNIVREHQPIARAEIARKMMVGTGRVTLLVNELLREGWLVEGETVDAPRGRRPRMLRLRTHDRLIIAVDVRFSRTFVMLSDFGGTQIALESFPTCASPDALIHDITERVDSLLRTHGNGGRCEGVGLVIPGNVDPRTGTVLSAPQLGWRMIDIRERLEAATGLPVYLDGAPVACALAQLWFSRHEPGAGSFVYVTVSEGVGAGVVVDNQIVRGLSQTAGEFGHTLIDPDGPPCMCGSRGCLEAYTSNVATLSRYMGVHLPLSDMRQVLQESGLTMPILIQRAREGDERARDALLETGRYLGLGLSTIVNFLNPERIYVGGEITTAWDLVEPRIRSAVRQRALTAIAAETPIIPDRAQHPRLRGATVLVTAPLFAVPRIA